MKTSTKYGMIAALGGIGLFGGSASLLVNGCNHIRDLNSAAQEIKVIENKKDDLTAKLETCLENSKDDCSTIFSEYKTVNTEYLALKKQYAVKESETAWFSALLMIGGYVLASSGAIRYRQEKSEEAKAESIAKADKL